MRDLGREAGIDFAQLSRIEAGLNVPPPDEKVRALARALSCSAAELDELLALAYKSRIPKGDVNAALTRNPELGVLLRRVRDRRLTPAETRLIEEIVEGRHEGDAEHRGNQEGQDATPDA